MCLIAFSYKTHPVYDLILATNRDEFYQRPARTAQFWKKEDNPDILAGKDLEAGGTWMGVHKDGRWGAVTNYRDTSITKKDAPSRGELVLDYLKSKEKGMNYLQEVTERADEYYGFNMLLWDEAGFFHYSNQSKIVSRIEPGIHGLSNSLLNTDWPKVRLAKDSLKNVIQNKNIDKEHLFRILLNEQKAPDPELPVTGIPQHLEKAVSSIFIQTESYGTRCSTVLLIDKDGKIDFTERTFRPGTKDVLEERSYNFDVE